MKNNLTWLHISDIHFHPKTEWRDSAARAALLTYLRDLFERDESLRPDLIFCTGDIAFGETSRSPLAEQYKQAETFFDSLLAICGRDSVPLAKERLFVVPGNHDVNRSSINSDAQAVLTMWAEQAREKAPVINQRFQDRPKEFKDAIQRLDEYAQFIESYLPHHHDPDGRHRYARVIDIDGLKVGIAGFNSAWSCSGPEDDRTLWLAAEWQFNAAQSEIKDADIRVGLIHHPSDWLNAAEQDFATRRIAADFNFWLHGHIHNAWVVPAQSHVTVAAGAVGAETGDEFGVNLTRLDLSESTGVVHLHAYSPRDRGWVIAPVAEHAPDGRWPFNLPARLRRAAPTPVAPPNPEPELPPKRTPGLFGRERLIKDATAALLGHPFLLVYGLRGNGKSAFIDALAQESPLAGKELIHYVVTPSTTPDDLFRQFATPLGETAESPKCPAGDARRIAEELWRRYPAPRPVWIWIDRAHLLLDDRRCLLPEFRNLLTGIQSALGMHWHWVLEFRERPDEALLGASAAHVEVPGLDKASLAECLAHGAPPGQESVWSYSGKQLKGMYQWLGGGHTYQAHPLATQLLIEVARGRNETPYDALYRHRGDLQQRIEEKLLDDLYNNVLSDPEQRMIQALALYRSAIPHDHADMLESYLGIYGAWEGLDRRCLLSASADHSSYYLHSFIASWVRIQMGFPVHGEDADIDLAVITAPRPRQRVRELHSAIAACWLDRLGSNPRITNFNISRALEAFHHLISAGEISRVKNIAIKLLQGNLEWAIGRIRRHYENLFSGGSPTTDQRQALEYWLILDPENHMAHRFLGECWVKEEGRRSPKALKCFVEACRLRRDFPPYWANLGKSLLAQGVEGARDFLQRLDTLEKDCPEAINDHVRAIRADCFELIGQTNDSTSLRMERINAGSHHAAIYNDEAQARLGAGDLAGALEILDLAERRGIANEYTELIRITALEQSGQTGQASALRMKQINAGSRDPAFYNVEAQARLGAGDSAGALEILDLAERRGIADEYTASIRANVLDKLGQAGEATALRMERINGGSRSPAIYHAEAQARLQAGDAAGALEILDLAEQRGIADEHTERLRANIK